MAFPPQVAPGQLARGLPMLGGAVDLVRPDPTSLAKALAPPPGETDEERDDEKDEKRKEELIAYVLDCTKAGEAAYNDQVQRELDDLNFELDQWPKEFREERKGGVAPDGHIIPAKPCLEINKLDQPIQQVMSEARMAKLAIEIKPRGAGASRAIAEVRQGLIRAIEVDSRAHIARLWALDRAVKCGRGAYRVSKRYSNDGDYDLDLVVERILNQHSVMFDPFAKEPDWSDGEWALVFTDIPENEYRRRWPESNLSRLSADRLQTLGNAQPSWISGEPQKRAFRVAEFYYVVHSPREKAFVPGVGDVWLDKLSKEELALIEKRIEKRRSIDRRHVQWAIVNVMEVLDEEVWEGRYIPIIPVTGKEYNVNGKRVWRGIITNAKDAQRSYNVMRSRQIEAIGLASLSTWVMAEGQDEGYEEQWDRANTSSFVRLIYKPTTFEGQLTPAPSRDTAEPAIAAITQAVREADADIKATTGRYDPSLGRARADQSGKAIKELKAQGESGTSNYLNSLAEVSMTYEGKVLNDMLEYVYDRPGRIIRLLGEDDEEREIIINQPYREMGIGRDRVPQPLGPGEQFNPEQHHLYNLADGGQYRVYVSVGPSVASAREEDRQFMTDLANAAPALVPVYADLWVRSADSKVSKQIADRLKRANPQAQGDDEGKTKPELPPEVVAQMQQMQQQLQQAQQAMQQMQTALDTDQAKQQANIQIAQMENESRERIAMMEARADLVKEQAKIKGDEGLVILEAEMDRMLMVLEQKHEKSMAREEREAATEGQLVGSMLSRPTQPKPPNKSNGKARS